MFFDFQCPYCKESLTTLEAWKSGSHKDINIKIIPFPLDNACNDLYTSDTYSGSCLATDVFHCLIKDKLWDLHGRDLLQDARLIFSDRKALKSIRWGQASVEDLVGKCLTDEQVWLDSERKSALDLAASFGVEGTPVFIDFREPLHPFVFEGALSVGGWERLWRERLGSSLSGASAHP
jgi:hypothetical protein